MLAPVLSEVGKTPVSELFLVAVTSVESVRGEEGAVSAVACVAAAAVVTGVPVVPGLPVVPVVRGAAVVPVVRGAAVVPVVLIPVVPVVPVVPVFTKKISIHAHARARTRTHAHTHTFAHARTDTQMARGLIPVVTGVYPGTVTATDMKLTLPSDTRYVNESDERVPLNNKFDRSKVEYPTAAFVGGIVDWSKIEPLTGIVENVATKSERGRTGGGERTGEAAIRVVVIDCD